MEEKILIVDDDPEIRNLCVEALAKEKYQIITSASGEEAFDLARQHDFSVVLSDIRMPGMNGLELLNNLKEINPEQTVIMFSGFGDVDAAVEAMKRGAFDYLAKPLILDELKITIRMALQQTQLRRENQKLKKKLEESVAQASSGTPTIPLLQNIPAEVAKDFMELGTVRSFEQLDVIVQEGKTNGHLYLILDGEVSVKQDGAELFRLNKFDSYGEMQIFRPNLGTQTLTAESNCNILEIDRDSVMQFFSRKEEKLFKHFILNTLNSTYLKLRRASSRIHQLERLLGE